MPIKDAPETDVTGEWYGRAWGVVNLRQGEGRRARKETRQPE